MRIAYAGHPGAFGELACLARFPDAEPVGHADFAKACAALVDGESDHAVIPFENSIAGKVPGVAELLAGLPVERIGVQAQPVAFHCLAPHGTRLEDMETIASHPMALAECRLFLSRLRVREEEAADTAGAASALAESGSRRRAALASSRAAELYDLAILEADVQDSADNITYFAVLRRA